MKSEIIEKYGNRVRVRVCGLCWKGNQLLLINHIGLSNGSFWAPPGGGVEFNTTVKDSLILEFQEETRLTIVPGELLFACEFIKQPLHAIELFFEVHEVGGEIGVGFDPESEQEHQIIKEVRYVGFEELMAIPEDERHGLFRFAKTASELKKMRGFYRI